MSGSREEISLTSEEIHLNFILEFQDVKASSLELLDITESFTYVKNLLKLIYLAYLQSNLQKQRMIFVVLFCF